jgi:hypothetical protein
MIITPATDELFGLDAVFGAMVVTEYTRGKISFWFAIIRTNNIQAVQCKKKNRFQL